MRRIISLFAAVATIATVMFTSQAWAGDREVAQQIAKVMRISGAMKNYDIAIKYSEGTAVLRGRVADQEQVQTAIAIAQASPEVSRVVNQLEAAGGSDNASSTAAPPSRPARSRPSVRQRPQVSRAGYETGANLRPAPRRGLPAPMAPSRLPGSGAIRLASNLVRAPAAAMGGAMGGPGPHPAYVPGTGGGVAPASYDQPNLPGHAWPSYAPYPNYAALTYPKQYSPTAWPYIGPFYPYPQVPLGWRKVTLEWDDGWWMLDFKD